MDSHAFRIIGQELLLLLSGARVEKIHGPYPDTFVFQLYTQGEKIRFVLHYERQQPFLFLTTHSFDNPQQPKSDVMRLRKYLAGRRLLQGIMRFDARCMVFPISNKDEIPSHFLLIDSKDGAKIVDSIPEDFLEQAEWPSQAIVEQLCLATGKRETTSNVWEQFSVLTPLLRETLGALEVLEAFALLVDLEAGGGDIFTYANDLDEATMLSAWPLPASVMKKRHLHECRLQSSLSNTLCSVAPNLAVASVLQEQLFFASVASARAKETQAPVKQELKKKNKLLQKLEQEESRLLRLLALREDAEAIQENVWQFSDETCLSSVTVRRSKDGEDAPPRVITLNAFLSVKENMLQMFKQSAKGKRGLRHLYERKQQVQQEHGDVAQNLALLRKNESNDDAGLQENSLHQKYHIQGVVFVNMHEEKDVARFISSDGFTMLRGKNAKGNARLQKLGKPHDLWLHAKDGPSAHLIIRRDHAGQDIPEQTLIEAAQLVGEKSWQKHAAKVEVMVASLRYVRSVKKAALGAVHVDKIEQTLVVAMPESISL